MEMLEQLTKLVPDVSKLPTNTVHESDLIELKRMGGNSGRNVFLAQMDSGLVVVKTVPEREGADQEVVNQVYAQALAAESLTEDLKAAVPVANYLVAGMSQVVGYVTPFLGETESIHDDSWGRLTQEQQQLFRKAAQYYLPVFAEKGVAIDGFNDGLRRNIAILNQGETKIPMFYDMSHTKDIAYSRRANQGLLDRLDFDFPLTAST